MPFTIDTRRTNREGAERRTSRADEPSGTLTDIRGSHIGPDGEMKHVPFRDPERGRLWSAQDYRTPHNAGEQAAPIVLKRKKR